MTVALPRRHLLSLAFAGALPTTPRAADNDIVLGQIGPFTGIPVPDAPQLNQGMRAALAQVNVAGGVLGRRLSLFELDDGYTADGFVHQFEEAMKRHPVALLSPVGSVALKRMLDDKLLDRHDVVVLNALPGAESLRNPGHPRLFHIRAGDRQQIERMVRHARSVGLTRLAVLHQDIPIGTSGLAVAEATAKGLEGLTLLPAATTLEPAALAQAVQKVAGAEAQGVLVLGAPRFMADAIVMLRKAGLNQFVFALSYVPPGLITQLNGSPARGVGLAQTYPNPNGINLAIQRDFQQAMKSSAAATGPWTAFHLEGYISVRVLVEALRRGKEASPAGLARALHTMGEVDLGGFRVNFGNGNVGSSFVDVGVINSDGRLVY
jgi:branched-chain amino acid transport system substrate-binding protein